MKNITVDKVNSKKSDGLNILKTSRPAQIDDAVWDDNCVKYAELDAMITYEMFMHFEEQRAKAAQRKRRNKLLMIVLGETVLIAVTMWLVQLAFNERGYMAFGGEWLPIISINLGLLIGNVKWGDE